MLEIRLNCENCDKLLPNESSEAFICSYECTFCKDCVDNILEHVCPNCDGNFEQRPIRPKHLLKKHPVSTKIIHKPVDIEEHLKRIQS